MGVLPPLARLFPLTEHRGRRSDDLACAVKANAISMNSFSTFSASLADVSKNIISCLLAKSSPMCLGISRLLTISVLLPR